MSHHRMLPPRYALIALGSGLLLVSASAKSAAFSPQLRALGAAGALAAGLACCIVAVVVTPVPRAWRRLYARIYVVAVTGGLTLCLVALVVLLAATLLCWTLPSDSSYPTDAIAYTHVNAQLALEGQNPYTSDTAFALALRRFPSAPATPLRRGAFATSVELPPMSAVIVAERTYLASTTALHGEFDPQLTHSYPALSFLLYVPLLWAGVGNILALHMIAYLALAVWLVRLAPAGMRCGAACAALAGGAAQAYALRADTEVICIALVLVAWHYRDSLWLGATLLGAACAFKQYCWLFVPFFVLDALCQRGIGAAGRRTVVALGTFVAINLPFLLASPHAWWGSLWLPLFEPFFPYGSGLIALSIDHVVPAIPAVAYGGMEGCILLVTLVCAYRWRAVFGEGILVLALVPLFFAFRSLDNYFAFVPWLAVYGVTQV